MELDFLLAILVWFGSNGVIALLVAYAVDVAKKYGWITDDGQSGKVVSALNLLGMIGFSVWFFLNPQFSFEEMDAVLKSILAIVQIVLGLFMQNSVSLSAHKLGKAMRLFPLGYSLTGK